MPDVVIRNGDTPLTLDTDFTVAFTNNIDAGEATVTVTGKGDYSGTKVIKFVIAKAVYDMSSVQWDYTEAFVYDGIEKTVILKSDLPSGVEIDTYSGNTATLPGTYTAKVTFVYDSLNYVQPVVKDLAWEIVDPKLLGDANDDKSIDIFDLVAIIGNIVNGSPVASEVNADANEDGGIDIFDLVWIINYIVGDN